MGYEPASEIKASGGSQPRNQEGASHLARRGKNAEAFLIQINRAEKAVLLSERTVFRHQPEKIPTQPCE